MTTSYIWLNKSRSGGAGHGAVGRGMVLCFGDFTTAQERRGGVGRGKAWMGEAG